MTQRAAFALFLCLVIPSPVDAADDGLDAYGCRNTQTGYRCVRGEFAGTAPGSQGVITNTMKTRPGKPERAGSGPAPKSKGK